MSVSSSRTSDGASVSFNTHRRSLTSPYPQLNLKVRVSLPCSSQCQLTFPEAACSILSPLQGAWKLECSRLLTFEDLELLLFSFLQMNALAWICDRNQVQLEREAWLPKRCVFCLIKGDLKTGKHRGSQRIESVERNRRLFRTFLNRAKEMTYQSHLHWLEGLAPHWR